MTSRIGLSLFLLAAGLGACASAAPPMNAEGPGAAIRAAEEVGADKIPEAALRLQLAKEQLERAKSMTSENQKDGARRLMMSSQVDA
jgi:ActR/RegA family two-component response regulator